MEATTDKNQNQQSVIVKDKTDSRKKSVCGVMKDHTIDVIQKIESEMPPIFQSYSDLYTRYLHSIRDIFGTCSLAEKQYFDKMDVDQNAIRMYDDYLKSVTNILKSQIDLSADFVRRYVQFRLSAIDSWDTYAHACINTYAKSLAGHMQREK
jgi:hypothetical protein